MVARYPAGAQVIVFYNPQNPSDAVLERKVTMILAVFTALMIANPNLASTSTQTKTTIELTAKFVIQAMKDALIVRVHSINR